jgi:hypothetical protein
MSFFKGQAVPPERFAREQPLRSLHAILGADEVELTTGRRKL